MPRPGKEGWKRERGKMEERKDFERIVNGKRAFTVLPGEMKFLAKNGEERGRRGRSVFRTPVRKTEVICKRNQGEIS